MAQDHVAEQTVATTADKTPTKTKHRRVPSWYREACRIKVREGIPWDKCAERVGRSPSGLFKARQQPHNKAVFEQEKTLFIQEIEEMRAPYKALAFEHAAHLLKNSKSDATQARMVEFLAGEGRGNSVNVAVNVQNNVGGEGYEYPRRGQRLVDITPGHSDDTSVDPDADEPEK